MSSPNWVICLSIFAPDLLIVLQRFSYVCRSGSRAQLSTTHCNLAHTFGGQASLEEERRLAYVGITRARERCYISFVANRQIYGRWQAVMPSRFVDELPHEHVDAVSETGYSGMPGAESAFIGTVEDQNAAPLPGVTVTVNAGAPEKVTNAASVVSTTTESHPEDNIVTIDTTTVGGNDTITVTSANNAHGIGNAFDGRQRAANQFDRRAVPVQEARAQRRRHANAAVVGGAAADADHQMGNPQIQRRRDQFSRAEGGGEHGVEPVPGQQRQAAGGRHFNRRQSARGHMAEGGVHGVAARAGDGDGARLAVQGVDQHIGQSVAAVSDRNPRDVAVRTSPRDAASHGFRRLGGGQATLECIGGEYDFHMG